MLIPKTSSFEVLLNYFGFFTWLSYLLSISSILWLRYKKPDATRPYKVTVKEKRTLFHVSIVLSRHKNYEDWRCGSLMVSALDSGSSGAPRARALAGALRCVLGQDTLCSLLTVRLSTEVFKWVPANLLLGVTCDELASYQGK